MQQPVKVSVIIPVYNAEEHLRQCLDSVIHQSLREIEIICVDDGSTDSSPVILEEYAESDPRIQLYHQQNLYAGVARNTGMSHACGKYLAFWDADDYFYPEALEKMFNKAEEDQADICLCDANQYYDGIDFETKGGMYLSRLSKDLFPSQMPFSFESDSNVILNVVNTAPWNKLFLHEFVKKAGLHFQGTRNANDMFFVECAIAIASSITMVNEPLMVYRKNQESSLVGSSTKAPFDAVNALIAIHDELIRRNRFPRKSFINRAVVSLIYLLRNACRSSSAFMAAVDYIKETGLMRLSLDDVSEEDFYNPWHFECLSHLKYDSSEEFMAFLFHFTYVKLTEANAKRIREKQKGKDAKASLKKSMSELKQLKTELSKKQEELDQLHNQVAILQQQLDDTLNSHSYRIGHALMKLPGKLKNH